MKRLAFAPLVSTVVLGLWIAMVPWAMAEKVNVFLLGGQSNMQGIGLNTQLPAELQGPQNDVLMYFGSSLTALKPGFGQKSTQFGPEITFGRTVADALPDEKFALIKYAAKGTDLKNEWDPSTGPRYATFRNTVSNGLAALANAGHTVEIVGMLWTQGERDARLGFESEYEANLNEFTADVRTRYGTDLPFFISQLSSQQTDLPADGLNGVRQAQANVAAGDPNSYLIKTDTFGGGNLHFNSSGLRDLGEAFGNAYVATDPSFGTSQAVTTVLIDGTNVNGDGDGYTLNGSFEQGKNPWEMYPGLTGNFAANVISSTVNPGTDPDPESITVGIGGVGSGTKGITIDTHVADGENPGDYTIALGDKFDLSFAHAGVFGWLDGDAVEWELYYTDDDTLEGTQTLLANGSVLPTPRTGTGGDPQWQNHWQTETVLTAEVTDSNAVGRHLWLGFKPNQGGDPHNSFTRVDEVNLSVVGEASGLTGDYNDDGVVDASDYTVWRDNLGSSVSLPNDLTPGTVDVTDYNVWKSNYAQATNGSLAGVNGATVPEPASLLLLIPMAIAGMEGLRRRQ